MLCLTPSSAALVEQSPGCRRTARPDPSAASAGCAKNRACRAVVRRDDDHVATLGEQLAVEDEAAESEGITSPVRTVPPPRNHTITGRRSRAPGRTSRRSGRDSPRSRSAFRASTVCCGHALLLSSAACPPTALAAAAVASGSTPTRRRRERDAEEAAGAAGDLALDRAVRELDRGAVLDIAAPMPPSEQPPRRQAPANAPRRAVPTMSSPATTPGVAARSTRGPRPGVNRRGAAPRAATRRIQWCSSIETSRASRIAGKSWPTSASAPTASRWSRSSA